MLPGEEKKPASMEVHNAETQESNNPVESVEALELESSFTSREHTQTLIENVERLRIDSSYTDLVIKIENQQFPCHKVICLFA